MSQPTLREPSHDIADAFVSRWSQRALTGAAIPDGILFRAFEAARWAPSGGNTQPWRFIYAKQDSPRWNDFLALINERNQLWAAKASALIALLSRTVRDTPQGPRPSPSHAFDTGAAWSSFAHQAHLLGWSTRAIGGFDRERARTALAVPPDYEIQVFIAIGQAGAKDDLPESLRAQEFPTGRQSLSELVADGHFSFDHSDLSESIAG